MKDTNTSATDADMPVKPITRFRLRAVVAGVIGIAGIAVAFLGCYHLVVIVFLRLMYGTDPNRIPGRFQWERFNFESSSSAVLLGGLLCLNAYWLIKKRWKAIGISIAILALLAFMAFVSEFFGRI
ncbi:MAG TPA: hypothetical protein VGJ04_04420 [Pirellulales bacterium]|jgi:disulfide bond formation protein DsbB